MFVSGTLKAKTINFVREKMISFDKDYIETSDLYLGFNGELVYSPWEVQKEEKLNKHRIFQEQELERKIYELFPLGKCATPSLMARGLLKDAIKAIKDNNKAYIFALLECLYKFVLANKYNINSRLKSFYDLLQYLNKFEDLSQVDLDIVLKLFLDNLGYNEYAVLNYKIKRFGIDETKIKDSEYFKLYSLGTFIAPNRMFYIRNSIIREDPYAPEFLPIYFALKSDDAAKRFLGEIDPEDVNIEEAMERTLIPNNLREMVKR